MATRTLLKRVQAEHGVVCDLGKDTFGYFGWPSVGRMEDGTLVAVASGMRMRHVCPYGRTVFLKSTDEGRTWTSPRVVNDSPFDDRDAGIVPLGGQRLLLSWFISDTRFYAEQLRKKDPEWEGKIHADVWSGKFSAWGPGLLWMNDANAPRFVGAWVRTSDDGGDTWNPPVRAPLNTPHGPIRLRSGRLLYFGKDFGRGMADMVGGGPGIVAAASADGLEWQLMGRVPEYPGTHSDNYHEPHAVELPSGRLVGLIRFQSSEQHDVKPLGLVDPSLMQSESADGGRTWTPAKPLGFHAVPPHVFRHSSGTLVCVYGYRRKPFGQRAMISRDEGQTWDHDYILRSDGPSGDLGYPSSVELADGSVFTLYYQATRKNRPCSLLWTRWRLPARGKGHG